MSRSPRRLLAAVGAAVICLLPVASATEAGAATAPVPNAPAVSGPAVSGPVVLLGTAGLRWDDIGSDTPALYALLNSATSATMTVRSVRDLACPVDGWLAVSAGRRAADAPAEGGCRIPRTTAAAPGGPATVDRWSVYLDQARSGHFAARPGLLATSLKGAGRSVAAVGPAAAIAAADETGQVPRLWPGLPAGPEGTVDPAGDAVDLSVQVKAALATSPDLVLVDVGSLTEVATAGPGSLDQDGPATRAEQVTALDTRIGLILGQVPAGATVLVASLADSGGSPRLQAIAAIGADGDRDGRFPAGLGRTGSTRQSGLVQSTDLLPTLLDLLDVPLPTEAIGAPLRSVPAGDGLDRFQRLLDLDEAARTLDPLVAPFFLALGVLQLTLYVTLAFMIRSSRATPDRLTRAQRALAASAATFALVPAATFLANAWPWWRAASPGTVLSLAVFTATAVLAVPIVILTWRRSPLAVAGAVGAVTTGVLLLDLVTGSRLSLTTLMGGQPLVAGRFYGLSNPGSALFATGAVLASLALVEFLANRGHSRARAAGAVAVIGILAAATAGAPALGSDFGGPLAIVPAFALLTLWVARIRVTWRRLTAIAAGTLTVIVGLSVLDWWRPAAERSHLGRFVQAVLNGDAWLIVTRKAEQNLDGLVTGPQTMVVPVVAVVVVWALARPGRWRLPTLQLAYDRIPLLRTGMAAIGVLLGIGLLVNDSGVSIPPVAFALLGPALIAVTSRTAIDARQEEHQAALRAAAAGLRPDRKRPKRRPRRPRT